MLTDILLGCIVGSLIAIGQNLRTIADELKKTKKEEGSYELD